MLDIGENVKPMRSTGFTVTSRGRAVCLRFKLLHVQILKPSVDIAQQHYAEHEGKPFYPKLVDFLTSGPVVSCLGTAYKPVVDPDS